MIRRAGRRQPPGSDGEYTRGLTPPRSPKTIKQTNEQNKSRLLKEGGSGPDFFFLQQS